MEQLVKLFECNFCLSKNMSLLLGFMYFMGSNKIPIIHFYVLVTVGEGSFQQIYLCISIVKKIMFVHTLHANSSRNG